MPSTTEITVSQLMRRIGLADTPVLIDVRIDDDVAADPRLLPCAVRRDFRTVADWAGECHGRDVVVYCQKGHKLSQGVVAWLRHAGIAASSLEGGFVAWREAQGLLLSPQHLPPRNARGASVWVTRARPKVDRIACPWLIRRFIDPGAVFLFVAATEVLAVADRFHATPFDIEDVFFSHRGETCSFDTMLKEFTLSSPALDRFAAIIRAADTAKLDQAPEAAGFLAASLGFSRLFRDDLVQLDAAMGFYDAMYRWCRDAHDETHNWPNPTRQG